DGQRIAKRQSGVTTYYHADHLGSDNVQTDTGGAQLTQNQYLPYGEFPTTPPAGSSGPRYTGQYYDEETGLYYYGARYYNPTIGRFFTADALIGNPTDSQSFNRYSYVKNNPINYIDPTGNEYMDLGTIVVTAHKPPIDTLPMRTDVTVAMESELVQSMISGLGNGASIAGNIIADTSTMQDSAKLWQAANSGSLNDAGLRTIASVGILAVTADAGFNFLSGGGKEIVNKAAKSAAITMDRAIELGSRMVQGKGQMIKSGNGAWQFIRTTLNKAGQKITRIARFDINPASKHIQQIGPHLNLETQIEGKVVGNIHLPIDPNSIRPGDIP
ncbi:MAG: RHS repeat-associated core domain-containing protein, partial [Candidatus Omnitrophica bacterium]|nr:RHS repeat-associated core domain-containing protein [Candidatus Omnitrophota bacterium]